jgi:YidC/Oxa1 family membrane protein insertase
MSDPKSKNKELSMEQRLLLAFGLMGLVLMVSTYLTPPPPPQQKTASKQATGKAERAAAAVAEAKPVAAGKRGSPPVPIVASSKEETFSLETDLYRITFSNRGGTVQSWTLRRYKDSKGKELELVNPKGAGKVVRPFSIRFHVNQASDTLNNALYRATRPPDRLGIEFEFSDGTWLARKKFAFRKDSYVAQVSSEVRYAGTPKPHLLYWLGGFGDASVIGATAAQLTVRYDLATQQRFALYAKDARASVDGYQAHRGRFAFAGLSDSFFAALALPPNGSEFEIHSLAHDLENSTDGKVEPHVGMAIGGDGVNNFPLFVGPKETNLLRATSPVLINVIDYGWFWFLADPLFRALNWVYANAVHHWGWTIVVVTIIINVLLLPLRIYGFRTARKMSVLQPQLAEIRKKYTHLSMTDARRKEEQNEMMALYQKHGLSMFNPSGCLPMFLQIPFLVAFYNVLLNAIELRGASWLWVSDLSRPEAAFDPIRILPLLMVATQMIMTKMTPMAGPDARQQQRIMIFSSVMFIFIFWASPSGLMLYWVTGNLVGIVQQWLFNRMHPVPAAAPAPLSAAQPKKKGGK